MRLSDILRPEHVIAPLHADRLIVQSGDGHSIVCTGGASSWQDLTLLLVAKFAGTAEAKAVDATGNLIAFEYTGMGHAGFSTNPTQQMVTGTASLVSGSRSLTVLAPCAENHWTAASTAYPPTASSPPWRSIR